MKKFFIPIGLLCCVTGAAARAETGDVTDHIYSTDIRAFINEVEVESYAIDGKTVVAVEDVTDDYSYNDSHRTLLIGGFEPCNLRPGEAKHSAVAGRIIGDVYETDIKTYVYDTELTAYALNGKTAVALEDLGGDQTWSELGGRYKWDPDARTISLETIYSSDAARRLLGDKNIRITINEDRTEAEAEFYFDKFSVGGSIDVTNEPESGKAFTVPIYTTVNGERRLLGQLLSTYKLFFDVCGYDMGNGEIRYGGDVTGGKAIYSIERIPVSFRRLNDDVVAEGAAAVESEELTEAEKVLKEYITVHACTVIDRFDTDEYTFVYMVGSTPHGGTDILMRINPDGSYRSYSDDFESVSLWGQKKFDNVTIDRINEKVHFRYDTDYVIYLKTGEMTKAG